MHGRQRLSRKEAVVFRYYICKPQSVRSSSERADLLLSHVTANGTARAERPSDSWHVIVSETQQPDVGTCRVRKDGNGVPLEHVLCLNGPPYKVYEIDIRFRTAFHYSVDAEKRNSVLQITLTYNIPADIHVW